MTFSTSHQQQQSPALTGDLQRQAQAAGGSKRSGHQSLGRPFPGSCAQASAAGAFHPRSLLVVMEELSDAVRLLTSALVGEVPGGLEPLGLPDPMEDEGLTGFDAPLSCPLPLQHEPLAQGPSPSLAGALTPEQEAQILAEATELWDTPWEELSVVELRALLRDLPIDRSALPAPIEYLRRSELLDALLTLPAIAW
jgi:hypothetical protein